jgi:hypothetical protein
MVPDEPAECEHRRERVRWQRLTFLLTLLRVLIEMVKH